MTARATWWTVVAGAGLWATVFVSACNRGATPNNDAVQGTEDAVLTDAPTVPPPMTRTHATKVTVTPMRPSLTANS